MLGSGKALSRDEAILYAQKNGYVFLHANNILGDSK
jgi:hypothetical protein